MGYKKKRISLLTWCSDISSKIKPKERYNDNTDRCMLTLMSWICKDGGGFFRLDYYVFG